jgi:hypothetical protein
MNVVAAEEFGKVGEGAIRELLREQDCEPFLRA